MINTFFTTTALQPLFLTSVFALLICMTIRIAYEVYNLTHKYFLKYSVIYILLTSLAAEFLTQYKQEIIIAGSLLLVAALLATLLKDFNNSDSNKLSKASTMIRLYSALMALSNICFVLTYLYSDVIPNYLIVAFCFIVFSYLMLYLKYKTRE